MSVTDLRDLPASTPFPSGALPDGWSKGVFRTEAFPEEPVLEVRDLCRSFPAGGPGGAAVLANDRVSLTVGPGEVVALLGPNGAGKSTFLRQVAGQLCPTRGSIRVAGVDMVASPREAKEALSVIPQEGTPYGGCTVREFVRMFARLKGVENTEVSLLVSGILDGLNLRREADTLIRNLSGGYKRRVMMAAAMAGRHPRLMLLDEPTTGLDPTSRRSVWEVIQRLRDRGLGILLTTHYLEEAETLADRVVILLGGRVLADGTVSEVRRRFPVGGRLEVRGLDGLSTVARREAMGLVKGWPVISRSSSWMRLQLTDPFAPEAVGLARSLTALGALATLGTPSLEDVYLDLVGDPEALV